MDLHTARAPASGTKDPRSSPIKVSLDAREQSLLYCELEYHLSNALNSYIASQLDRGNLVAQKLQRIAESWSQLGRPRVIGFRYDLETQLDLVHLHIEEFVFHGRRQSNPSEISGLLQAMKTNARAMRVRTFCQPDTVIAKQLVDAQSLFHLIGVGSAQNKALSEVAHFFKVIVERETSALRRQVEEEHARVSMAGPRFEYRRQPSPRRG